MGGERRAQGGRQEGGSRVPARFRLALPFPGPGSPCEDMDALVALAFQVPGFFLPTRQRGHLSSLPDTARALRGAQHLLAQMPLPGCPFSSFSKSSWFSNVHPGSALPGTPASAPDCFLPSLGTARGFQGRGQASVSPCAPCSVGTHSPVNRAAGKEAEASGPGCPPLCPRF